MKGMNIWNSFQQMKNGYLSDKELKLSAYFHVCKKCNAF